jgi:hypothetical protein
MKNFIFVFLFSVALALAQDSSMAVATNDTVQVSEPTAEIPGPVQQLNADDFKKFYIGFTNGEESLEVITLNIRDINQADSSITFNYTLNTHNNREDGNGQIWPERSLIRFQNLEEGRILIPEDGKIVFESLSQDSLNYWKLKEK